MELQKRIEELERMGFKVLIEIGAKKITKAELSELELKSTHHTTYDKVYLRKGESIKVIRLHRL